MSMWRPARADELARLWPAARSAHLASSPAEFQAFYAEAPWRVRVSEAGDVLVLRRWRAHLDVLAMRAAWAPPHRVSKLVAEAKSVARSQGYGRLVSPLVAQSSLEPYHLAGMADVEQVVALQGIPATILERLPIPLHFSARHARSDDVDALVALDGDCFDDFWRYGREEFESALEHERIVLVEGADGVAGYSSASITGSACTLGRLAVAGDARGRGIGSALIRDVAEWAASSEALALSLCTQAHNVAARSLYRRAGLMELEDRYAIALCEAGDDSQPNP